MKGNTKKFLLDYEKEYTDEYITEEQREHERYVNSLKADKVYDAQQGKNNISPFLFAESTYLLDGRPMRFKDRDYLNMIYDTEITDGLLMCGRQVEKSTTFSVHIANWTLLVPFCRSLYFAPLNEQVKVFSEDRLGRLFEYSQEDVIKKTFMSSRDKQNVFNKSFSNGSLIYLRHCYDSGDNIRGLSVNGLFGDEVQDIDIDALPVVQETQAHAYDLGPGVKFAWFSGTPKTFSNTIQQLWDRGNQCEWVVRCWRCNADQILGIKNIAEDRYVCRKCGRTLERMNISKGGRWVKLNRNGESWGFRITQMMNPAMLPEDTFRKMKNYDSKRFYNEVLGRSYEDAEKPFPPMLINQMMANELPFYNGAEREFMYQPTFMGIDWGTGGKSLTIVTIFGLHLDGRKQILYTKAYKTREENEREYQFNDICRLMHIYRVNYCIADYGHGFEINQKLKNEFGDRFDCLYYSHGLGVMMKYDANKIMWVGNRTMVIHDYVTDCKNGKVVWPGAEADNPDMITLKEHHLAEQAEYKSTRPRVGGNAMVSRSEELYYTHPVAAPDDGLHSCVYANIAAKLRPNQGGGIVVTSAISR